MQEETHNSPDISKNGWKHLTQRVLEVVGFTRCNHADIDQCVRIPGNPPLVESKGKMLLEL